MLTTKDISLCVYKIIKRANYKQICCIIIINILTLFLRNQGWELSAQSYKCACPSPVLMKNVVHFY